MTGSIHLHPTAPLAERVLLPGDPGRALFLAQTLLDSPKMFNHNRGLWGYTGTAPDGQPLTVQSTGMGGPSAAIVIAELADLGARRLLRVGTCGALSDRLVLGQLLVATEAIAGDGTSRSLSAAERDGTTERLTAARRIGATPQLLAQLRSAATAAPAGPVVSTDLFYDAPPGQEREWLAAGALAVEMETATLFALAVRRRLEAASLLIVSDLVLPVRERIAPEALRDAEQRMGQVALQALS